MTRIKLYNNGNLEADEFVEYVNTVPKTLAEGLVSWWKLDNGSAANAIDSAHNGTITGSFTQYPDHRSQPNKAFYTTNGGSNYITFPALSEFVAGQPVTISFWLYPKANGTQQRTIICSASGYNKIFIDSSNGTFWWNTYGAQFIAYNDRWTLVTLTYNGSSLYFFSNGIYKSIQNGASNLTIGNFVYIFKNYSTEPLRYYVGGISDFKIFNRVLNADEVFNLYKESLVSFDKNGIVYSGELIEDDSIVNDFKFNTTDLKIKGEFNEREIVYDIDNNPYSVVRIGVQEWMQQNLKTTKYNDGSSIPNITVDANWQLDTSGAYCWYNNNESTYKVYGALYNWHAVNTGKLAPIGWKIPNDEDFKILERFLGLTQIESDTAGTYRGTTVSNALKEIGTTYWSTGNLGNNLSNFTGYGAGYRSFSGTFSSIKSNLYIWLSTQYSATHSWDRTIPYNNSGVYRYYYQKEYGFSTRCLRVYKSTSEINNQLVYIKDYFLFKTPSYTEILDYSGTDYGYPTNGYENQNVIDIQNSFYNAGYSILLKLNVNHSMAVATDSDAAAFISIAGITDETQIFAINYLVTNLKNYGLWNKYYAIYPFVGGTADSHKYNLKDPRDLDEAFRLAFYGTVYHSSNGVQGDGSTGWANTFLYPNITLTLNSTHFSVYSESNTDVGFDFGVSYNGQILCTIKNSGSYQSRLYDAIAGGGYLSSTSLNSLGHFIFNRYSSTDHKLYKNGYILGSNNTSGGVLSTRSIYFMAYNGNVDSLPTPGGFTSRLYSFFSIGSGLSQMESSIFSMIVNNYQCILHRQV